MLVGCRRSALLPRWALPALLSALRKHSTPPSLPPRPCAVRVGYPCFGEPRRAANGRIEGYPMFGHWRVHNFYCHMYQEAPKVGIMQPYQVSAAYRF